MASRNDVAIAWGWISILGKRPVGPKSRGPQAPLPIRPEMPDNLEDFEEDFRIVSLLWTGPTH